MATGPVFDNKHVEFKEAFALLESQETEVYHSIKTLITENLDSTKESWLINSLVDYYYSTKSPRVVDVLCAVQTPHDKFLLEKLHDGIKSKEDQPGALELLLHVVSKQPSWINKVVHMPVLKVVIKCLKSETNVPVLMTGVMIVTMLLPSVPNLIGPYLPDIFEIFNRLAAFTIKKPVGNTPDMFLLHLQISVYSLFHRLYGMYPYNFLAYLRHYYTKKDNSIVFEEVIKNMLERVRLHPKLITGTKEHETSSQRWKKMETHDIIVECARMSLDPVEGTWEELKCPIVSSRYMIDRPLTNQIKAQPSGSGPWHSVGEYRPAVLSADNTFWSPSEVIGLATPPSSQRNTPAIPTLDIPQASQYSQQSGGTPHVTHSIITPSNTLRETPPISEEHDKSRSRSSRLNTSKTDPKRLSADFTLPGAVPLLTPSSTTQSVPPSPLKAEFTSTPPIGVKALPVLYAARELQFDCEQPHTDDAGTGSKVLTDNIKTMLTNIQQKKPPIERLGAKDGSRTPSRSNSAVKVEELLSSSIDNAQPRITETTNRDMVSVDNLQQVIQDLNPDSEDSDEEVSTLTSDHVITAESVAKFMRSVNRIRFNSLSTTNSIDLIEKFGPKRSRSCPQLPKIEPMTEEEETVSRSASTMLSERGTPSYKEAEGNNDAETSNIAERKNPDAADNLCDISISSTGSTVTVNTKLETKVMVETTTTSTVNVTNCPGYTGGAANTATDDGSKEENRMTEIFKQLLNPVPMTTCQKCPKGDDSKAGSFGHPYFSSFSPHELLNQHIKMGGEIHAKELSKLPMPSAQNVNWTHFGGAPPADEISILRGQIMLLHNQLLYERNKREHHAKRNRRLLRKIANTKILEGQNEAMISQIKDTDKQIRDFTVSIKSLEEENRRLKSAKDSDEYQKLVQLKSCLQENEVLKTTKLDQNELLERQKEDQENLRKKLMSAESALFTAEKELETMRNHATMNVKLKEQVFQLQKEVTLMGELLQKNLNNRVPKHPKQEYEKMQKVLKAELQGVKTLLEVKTKQLDSNIVQMDEKNKNLENKEITLSELKLSLERVKSSHNAELRCVEDKHQSVLRINQALESQILQLNTELEEVKSKLRSKEKASPGKKTESSSMSGSGSCKADPPTAQPDASSKSQSASTVGSMFENSETILEQLRKGSPDFLPTVVSDDVPSSSETATTSNGASNLEATSGQCTEIKDKLMLDENVSLSSHDSCLGHRLLDTDSEDNRSVSVKSSNLGDSGFG